MIRSRIVVPIVGLAVLAAGCAGVPEDGPVQSVGVQERAALIGEAEIRVEYRGPAEDARPEEVVRGFLAANGATTDGLDRARRYLSAATAASWAPTSLVVVDSKDVRLLSATGAGGTTTAAGRQTLLASTVARVDRYGRYQPANDLFRHDFRLQATADGWRIVNPPEDLVLTVDEFQRVYRPADVFYLARGRSVLVPDRRFVPAAREEAAAGLLAALFDGPSWWLEPSVEHIPRQEAPFVSAGLADGVVDVRLGEEAAQLSESRRWILAAQIEQSLSQLEITGVRILAGDEPVDVSGATESDSSGLVADPGPPRLHMLADGRLTGPDGQAVAGSEDHHLDEVALSPAGRVAGIAGSAGPDVLVVDGVDVLGAASLGTPTWGHDVDRLYAVRGGSELVTVQLLDEADGAQPEVGTVTTDELPGRIISVAVAADGVRVAAVAGQSQRLYVGRLEGSPGFMALRGVHEPAPDLDLVSDVAWSSADTLLVGARVGGTGPIRPVRLGVDGSALQVDPGIGLPGDVSRVAAHAEGPAAVSSGGSAFTKQDGVWIPLSPSSGRPVYPG